MFHYIYCKYVVFFYLQRIHTIQYGIGPGHEGDIELGGSVVVGVVVAEGVFGTPYNVFSLCIDIFVSRITHWIFFWCYLSTSSS